MSEKLKEKVDIEKIVRNILIVLTFISIIITILNLTYLTYQNENVEKINDFLINHTNNWVLWLDNILLYIFSIIYMILGINSKKEVLLKISFSIFSILTTITTLTIIINFIAELFGMF